MELASQRYADVVVVSVTGRIDHRSAEDFERGLAPYLERCAAGDSAVVLDLAGVDYMSSVGLRVLMLASRHARRQDGHLVVCSLGGTLAEIFAISRFDKLFPLYDDADAALAALSGDAVAARRGPG